MTTELREEELRDDTNQQIASVTSPDGQRFFLTDYAPGESWRIDRTINDINYQKKSAQLSKRYLILNKLCFIKTSHVPRRSVAIIIDKYFV